jgi:hypothetical protein
MDVTKGPSFDLKPASESRGETQGMSNMGAVRALPNDTRGACSALAAVGLISQASPVFADACNTHLLWSTQGQSVRAPNWETHQLKRQVGLELDRSAKLDFGFKIKTSRRVTQDQIISYIGEYCEIVGKDEAVASLHRNRINKGHTAHFRAEVPLRKEAI